MNKAYVNKEELIISNIDDGWYDEENSIILVESIKPSIYPNNRVIYPKFYVRLEYKGVLEAGIKYKVDTIVSYFKMTKKNEAYISFKGESVTNYLGPRDILFWKNPSEEIWGNKSIKYCFNDMHISMFFQKGKGFTRQNISEKNGETIHYTISLTVQNIDSVNNFINIVKIHHDFIFGFNWLENEEIKFDFGSIPMNTIVFNEKITIKDIMINKLIPSYLGDASFLCSSDINFFLNTYNFIKLIRENNFLEIKISILATIAEILFEKFYIKNYSNGKKIKDLLNKIKWILPIDEDNIDSGINDFKNARNSISHSNSKKYDEEKAKKVIEKIIWLWSYFINKKRPYISLLKFFPTHSSDSKVVNNYTLYEVTKSRLKNLKSEIVVNYLYSTLGSFKGTIWEDEILEKMDSLLLNDYVFNHPNGYVQKIKISEDFKQDKFLIHLEQEKVDYKKGDCFIKYEDILYQSKCKIESVKLFFEYIINLMKPKFME